MGSFPVAKLVALLIKQVSKPIANYAKDKAKTSDAMKTYLCMPAQCKLKKWLWVLTMLFPLNFWLNQFWFILVYHWSDVKLRRWATNSKQPVQIQELNTRDALDLGANILGEGILFIVASVILIAEYTRQRKKEAAKEKAAVNKLENLQLEINKARDEMNKMNLLVLALQGSQECWNRCKRA